MGFGSVVTPQPPVLLEAVAVLPVRDLAQSVAFYGALGFAVDASFDDYAILASGACWLHLRTAGDGEFGTDDGEPFNPAGAYIFVADAQAVYALCGTAGIATINAPAQTPYNVLEFAVGDPSGNLLRFGQRLG